MDPGRGPKRTRLSPPGPENQTPNQAAFLAAAAAAARQNATSSQQSVAFFGQHLRSSTPGASAGAAASHQLQALSPGGFLVGAPPSEALHPEAYQPDLPLQQQRRASPSGDLLSGTQGLARSRGSPEGFAPQLGAFPGSSGAEPAEHMPQALQQRHPGIFAQLPSVHHTGLGPQQVRQAQQALRQFRPEDVSQLLSSMITACGPEAQQTQQLPSSLPIMHALGSMLTQQSVDWQRGQLAQHTAQAPYQQPVHTEQYASHTEQYASPADQLGELFEQQQYRRQAQRWLEQQQHQQQQQQQAAERLPLELQRGALALTGRGDQQAHEQLPLEVQRRAASLRGQNDELPLELELVQPRSRQGYAHAELQDGAYSSGGHPFDQPGLEEQPVAGRQAQQQPYAQLARQYDALQATFNRGSLQSAAMSLERGSFGERQSPQSSLWGRPRPLPQIDADQQQSLREMLLQQRYHSAFSRPEPFQPAQQVQQAQQDEAGRSGWPAMHHTLLQHPQHNGSPTLHDTQQAQWRQQPEESGHVQWPAYQQTQLQHPQHSNSPSLRDAQQAQQPDEGGRFGWPALYQPQLQHPQFGDSPSLHDAQQAQQQQRRRRRAQELLDPDYTAEEDSRRSKGSRSSQLQSRSDQLPSRSPELTGSHLSDPLQTSAASALRAAPAVSAALRAAVQSATVQTGSESSGTRVPFRAAALSRQITAAAGGPIRRRAGAGRLFAVSPPGYPPPDPLLMAGMAANGESWANEDGCHWWRCPGSRKRGFCGVYIYGTPAKVKGSVTPYRQHAGPWRNLGTDRCNSAARQGNCPCLVGRTPEDSGRFICTCKFGDEFPDPAPKAPTPAPEAEPEEAGAGGEAEPAEEP